MGAGWENLLDAWAVPRLGCYMLCLTTRSLCFASHDAGRRTTPAPPLRPRHPPSPPLLRHLVIATPPPPSGRCAWWEKWRGTAGRPASCMVHVFALSLHGSAQLEAHLTARLTPVQTLQLWPVPELPADYFSANSSAWWNEPEHNGHGLFDVLTPPTAAALLDAGAPNVLCPALSALLHAAHDSMPRWVLRELDGRRRWSGQQACCGSSWSHPLPHVLAPWPPFPHCSACKESGICGDRLPDIDRLAALLADEVDIPLDACEGCKLLQGELRGGMRGGMIER